MAKILITGGSGLIGSYLSGLLARGGHEVVHLGRSMKPEQRYPTFVWDIHKNFIDSKALEGVEHMVHLAGAGVADRRWTPQRKREILESRTKSIALLHRFVIDQGLALRSFVTASAIGLYGTDTGSAWIDEDHPAGEDFLAGVVQEWEQTADLFQEVTKVAKVRTGVVLSAEGGALSAMARPVRYWAGAPLGTGTQYMSWIHIADLCRIFQHVLEHQMEGAYNAAAPNPVTNSEFTKALARTLKKPLILPNVPAFALRLLLGEMAGMLLGGSRVSAGALERTGFVFKFTKVEAALKDLLIKQGK